MSESWQARRLRACKLPPQIARRAHAVWLCKGVIQRGSAINPALTWLTLVVSCRSATLKFARLGETSDLNRVTGEAKEVIHSFLRPNFITGSPSWRGKWTGLRRRIKTTSGL